MRTQHFTHCGKMKNFPKLGGGCYFSIFPTLNMPMNKLPALILAIFLSVLSFAQAEKTFNVKKSPVQNSEEKKFHRTIYISPIQDGNATNYFLLDTNIAANDTIKREGEIFPLGKCVFTVSDRGKIFKAAMWNGVITAKVREILSKYFFTSKTAICFVDIETVKTTKGTVASQGGQYIVKLLY